MIDEIHPELVGMSAPLRISPLDDGMVGLAIGDNAVSGTWMDAIDLAISLMGAAQSAAYSIDVESGTIARYLLNRQ